MQLELLCAAPYASTNQGVAGWRIYLRSEFDFVTGDSLSSVSHSCLCPKADSAGGQGRCGPTGAGDERLKPLI